MKRTFRMLAFVGLPIIVPMAALASPCGAELCLSDFRAAKMAVACKPEMDSYFSIRRTKHGKFSPPRTYKARRDYLYKCDSGNTMQKEDIMQKFGYVDKPAY